jgi:phage shock protein C
MSNYQPYQPSPHPTEGRGKRLVRRSDNKMIAGVCGGLAVYTGIDANLIRIALVLAVVFGFGSGILLYGLAWWLMPKA